MPRYISGSQDLYESGLDNLIEALLNRHAVIAGSGAGAACQVIAHAAPDMGVRVGAGTIQGDAAGVPVRVAVAQTDLTITANGSANPRTDLVSVNFTTGVPTRTTGTAAVTPLPPALPATDILLGYVSVPPAAVNVQNANISDRRLFLPAFEDVTALLATPAAVTSRDATNTWHWDNFFGQTTGALNGSTVTGTGSVGTSADQAQQALATGATSGSNAGIRTVITSGSLDFAVGSVRRLLIGGMYVDKAANSNSRIYVTTESATGQPSDTANHIGIKKLGATINFSTANGATEQTTDISASFAANKEFNVVVTFDGTTAKCYVDGTLVATHATNVPSSTKNAQLVMRWHITNASATNFQVSANRFSVVVAS